MDLAITSIGVISPYGFGFNNFLNFEQKDSIKKEEDKKFNKYTLPISSFNPRLFTRNFKQLRSFSKSTHYAVAASKLTNETLLIADTYDSNNIGVIIGTSYLTDEKDINALLNAYSRSFDKTGSIDWQKFGNAGIKEIHPKWLLSQIANTATFAISYEIESHGYSNAIVTGGNSLFDALFETFIVLGNGNAECVFLGGSDCPLNLCDKLSLYQEKKSENFFVSEGSAVFCIENIDNAKARNAHISGIIKSVSSYILNEEKDLYNSLNTALKEARFSKAEIDLILLSDWRKETDIMNTVKIIKDYFENHSKNINLLSSMNLFGYTRAAAGAFEVALGLKIFDENKTIHFLDDLLNNNYSTKKEIRNILINYTGPSNCNYSVILQNRN